MAVDNLGVQYFNLEGQLPTYSIATIDYSPYVTATDMVVLQNPATSNVMIKVTQIRLSGTATAATMMDFYVFIRTALNTGGTSAGVTAAKHDSNSVAAQGSVLSYSAAPTLNGVGTIVRADRCFLPANGTPVAGSFLVFEFAVRGGAQGIHIRPGQQLSISNNSNAVSGGTQLYIGLEWNESTPVQ